MKPIALYPALALLTLAPLVGCEHHDAMLQYNPQVDSVLPTYLTSLPDLTILDDQRKIHDAMGASVKAPAPAAPASAPTAPTTPAAPGATPPPPA